MEDLEIKVNEKVEPKEIENNILDGNAISEEKIESSLNYDNLTPEQLDIKHKELKDQYGRMYDMIMSLIDRIGDVSPSEENIGTMQYVSKTLSTLKDMIIDYISKVYQTKSYIENSINYGRFLAQLNGINKILEEMNSKNEEN